MWTDLCAVVQADMRAWLADPRTPADPSPRDWNGALYEVVLDVHVRYKRSIAVEVWRRPQAYRFLHAHDAGTLSPDAFAAPLEDARTGIA